MKRIFATILSIFMLGSLSSCELPNKNLSYVDENGNNVEFQLSLDGDIKLLGHVKQFILYKHSQIKHGEVVGNAVVHLGEHTAELDTTITLNNQYLNGSFNYIDTYNKDNKYDLKVFVDRNENKLYEEYFYYGNTNKNLYNVNFDNLTSNISIKNYIVVNKIKSISFSNFVVETEIKMNIDQIPVKSIIADVTINLRTGLVSNITSTFKGKLPHEGQLKDFDYNLKLDFNFDEPIITPLTDEEKALYTLVK